MLDLSKPVIRRDGKAVRIICKDRVSNAGYSIVALVVDSDGIEQVIYYKKTGSIGDSDVERPSDLVNIKIKKWKWVYEYAGNFIVYPDYQSEEEIKLTTYHIVGRIAETEIEI